MPCTPCTEKVASTAQSVKSSIPAFRVVPLSRLWTLKAGEAISHGLEAWGREAHWTVLWRLRKDYAVPSTTVFSGSFESAVTKVLNTLSAEGVLLRGDIYESNHTIVVRSTGDRK